MKGYFVVYSRDSKDDMIDNKMIRNAYLTTCVKCMVNLINHSNMQDIPLFPLNHTTTQYN